MENHIVLTLGRSGSNTLCDMLNQSPEVLNYGEVLGEWTRTRKLRSALPFLWRSDEAFLDWILTSGAFRRVANAERNLRKRWSGRPRDIKRAGAIRTVGIKEFSLNFRRFGISDRLLQRPGLKVVGLVRRDVVDRMVSNALLGATGVVAARPGSEDRRPRLRLDPARIASMIETIEAENRELDGMLGRAPADRRLVIRYEDLYADEASRAATMRAVFEFLEVEPILPAARMRKIVREPVSELVENFDDCLAAVRGTHHEALLRAAAERGPR